MKTRIHCFALALGILICVHYTTYAQRLSTIAPIVVQVREISDYSIFNPRYRSDVDRMMGRREINGNMVHCFIEGLKEHEAQELENYGRFLPSLVWIMDGPRLVAEASVVGTVGQGRPNEYGLILWFDAAEDPNNVVAAMRQGSNLEELIRMHKSDLDNPIGWQCH